MAPQNTKLQVFRVPTTTRRGHVSGQLPKEIQILVCPPWGDTDIQKASGWDPDGSPGQDGIQTSGCPPQPGRDSHVWGSLQGRKWNTHQGCPLTTRRGSRHHLGVLRGGSWGQWVGVSPSPSAWCSGYPRTCCHPEWVPTPAALWTPKLPSSPLLRHGGGQPLCGAAFAPWPLSPQNSSQNQSMAHKHPPWIPNTLPKMPALAHSAPKPSPKKHCSYWPLCLPSQYGPVSPVPSAQCSQYSYSRTSSIAHLSATSTHWQLAMRTPFQAALHQAQPAQLPHPGGGVQSQSSHPCATGDMQWEGSCA